MAGRGESDNNNTVPFDEREVNANQEEVNVRGNTSENLGSNVETSTPSMDRNSRNDGDEVVVVAPGLLNILNQITSQIGQQVADANEALSKRLLDKVEESHKALSERLERKIDEKVGELKGELNKTNEVVEGIRRDMEEVKINLETGLGQANARVDAVEAKISEVETNLNKRVEENSEKIDTLEIFVQQENEIVKTEIRETREVLEAKLKQQEASTDRKISVVSYEVSACKENVRELDQKMNLLKEDIVTRNVGGGCGSNWANIVVKTYPGDGKIHPVDFIYHIRDNFTLGMTDNLKIKFVKKFLDNEALAWAHQTIREGMSYEEFERCFLNKFWSQRIQSRVMNEFLNGAKYKESDGSMKDFCEAQLRKLVYLDSKFNEMTQIDALKRKLPSRIQSDLRFASDESIEDFLKFVGKLDSSDNRGYNDREHRRFGNDNRDDREYRRYGNDNREGRDRREDNRNRDVRDRSREDRHRDNNNRQDRRYFNGRDDRNYEDRRYNRQGNRQEN